MYLTNVFGSAHTSLSAGDSIFLRQEGMFNQQRQKKTLLLSTAPEGKLFVDLDEQLKFPDHIVRTQLQPDMILVLNQMKKVIMWELMVSWEENMASPTRGSSLNISNLLRSIG